MRILVAEDVCAQGCVGSRLLALCGENGLRFKSAALVNAGDGLVRQGSVEEQERRLGLDAAGLAQTCERLRKREENHEKTTA